MTPKAPKKDKTFKVGCIDLDEMKKQGLIMDYKIKFDKKKRVTGILIVPVIYAKDIVVNIGFTKPS